MHVLPPTLVPRDIYPVQKNTYLAIHTWPHIASPLAVPDALALLADFPCGSHAVSAPTRVCE